MTLDRTARFGVIGAGAVVLAWIVVSSFDPDAYFYYRWQDRSDWTHPTGEVAVIAGATVMETVLAYLVIALQSPRWIWQRALIALGMLLPWTWIVMVNVIHAPGFWHIHALSLLVLISGLALVTGISAGRHVWSRVARR